MAAGTGGQGRGNCMWTTVDKGSLGAHCRFATLSPRLMPARYFNLNTSLICVKTAPCKLHKPTVTRDQCFICRDRKRACIEGKVSWTQVEVYGKLVVAYGGGLGYTSVLGNVGGREVIYNIQYINYIFIIHICYSAYIPTGAFTTTLRS